MCTFQYAYYRVVTESAMRANPDCPASVRSLLTATIESPSATYDSVVSGLGLCGIPDYIVQGGLPILRQELNMIIAYTWATINMENYPPTQATGLAQACAAIVNNGAAAPWQTLSSFLSGYSASTTRRSSMQYITDAASTSGCYNLSLQLPSGPNATISSGDWTGVGSGTDGSSWDEETCTFLVEVIGTNNVTDMFPGREFTMGKMVE